MKKKNLLMLGSIMFVIGIFVFIYPNIEFYSNNYLYMMSYGKDWEFSEDLQELEQEMCYDESYSYNKKRDISISNWEYKGILFFKWFKIEYKKGNVCATEYLLEESYIKHFIENAEIKENEDDKYSRGIIYRSSNKELLVKLQDKIMKDINSGKTRVKCITKKH